MKKIYCLVFSVVVLCLGFFSTALASTKGTEFWYAHVGCTLFQTEGVTRCYLYVYTEHPTTVQAHAPTTNWDTTVTALPGMTTIILPLDAINTGHFVTHGYGVHITADDSVSIVAHIGNEQIDQNGPADKEAALLLPVPALGYEYYVASSRVTHNFNAYGSTSKLIVVATENNTQVEITPSDTTVPEYPVGVPFTITLNRGEMFGLHASPYLKDTMKDTTSDLTGSYVRANAPIAVFGGTFGTVSVLKGSRSGQNYCFEQMAPVSMLGRQYILTPVLGTPQPYLCRIFAMYDSTKVTINNNPEMLLRKGQMYDLETQEALFVQSDKPVNVYQYIQNMIDSDTLNFGSSAFAAVQPLEQMALREVMFTDVPFNLPRRQTFVNVVLLTADLSSLIELDGAPINNTFIPIPAKPEYSYTRLRIPYGRDEHHIASLKPFMAYTYGSGSNLPYASNASPVYFHGLGGGSRNLLLSAQATPDTLCPDSTVTFTAQIDMALDTAGAVWLWDFGDGNTAQGQNTQHRYTTSGVYTVTLTVRKGTFLLVDPVQLTVTVAAPKVQSSSQLLDFGQISPCADAPVQEVILRNTGSRQAEIITSWASSTGFFSVETPALPLTLAVEDSQTLQLRFNSPGIAGIYRDTLRLPIEPCGDVLEISVVAEVLPGSITLQPVPLLFGVLSGCSKAQKDTTLTIRNTGKQDITISSALIATPFSVLNLPAPVLIPVGQEYTLLLRFTPTSPGVYTQQLQIAYTYAECDDTLRVSVSGELRGIPIEVSTRTDTTICPGGIVQLYATGGVRYQWTPTDGLNDATSATPVATPQRTTRYTVIATNETGCTGSSVVLVEVREAMRLQTTGGSTTCKGGAVQLSVSGAERYLWSPQNGLDDPTSATPISSVQTTTVYTVTGWTQGCITTAQVTVEVLPPPVISVRSDTSICMGTSVALTTEVQTNNTVRYQWQPSIGLDDATVAAPVATPLVTTLYTVEVTDNNGCSSSAKVQVEVREPSKLAIVVPDVLAAGERFVLPVIVKSPRLSLPLQNVQLQVDITYPSRMMLIESVSGGLIRQDKKINDDLHVISIETTSRSLVDVETQVALLHARALLTEQKEGQVQPVLVEVLAGECIVPDDGAGGILKVNGYCEAHDYRKFEPLTVQINPQPVDRESRIEVRTSIAGEYRASLYDSYGRVVWQSAWQQQDGVVHNEAVNTGVSSTGIYLLRVEGEGQTATQTVIMVR